MILRLYTVWCVLWLVASVAGHGPAFAVIFFTIATLVSSMALATRGAIRQQERQTLNRRHRLLAQRDQDRARRNQCRAPVAAIAGAVADAQLDVSNPTSVIRQRLESGGLYVPLGTCRCAAYPRAHQHARARTTQESLPPAKDKLFQALMSAPPKAPRKPCTEGGPCTAADRLIIDDGKGHRVASLCNRCDTVRYWLPFLENGK